MMHTAAGLCGKAEYAVIVAWGAPQAHPSRYCCYASRPDTCSALAAHRTHTPRHTLRRLMQVHVYERATALRPSGGSIGLSNQNAFRAFDALGDGVLDTVRGHGYERRSMTRTDHLGNDPVVVHPPSTIIAWYELQKALLACLPNETMVTLACEVDRVRPSPHRAACADAALYRSYMGWLGASARCADPRISHRSLSSRPPSASVAAMLPFPKAFYRLPWTHRHWGGPPGTCTVAPCGDGSHMHVLHACVCRRAAAL